MKPSEEMEVNYWWLGLVVLAVVVLAVVVLVIWLVRRNIRDRKHFERNFLQSDIKPEKHADEENDGV